MNQEPKRQLAIHPHRSQDRRVQHECDLRALGQVSDAVEVQPGDFVLVFVGHQFVHSGGVGLAGRRAPGQPLVLQFPDRRYRSDVPLGSPVSAPADEIGDADLDSSAQLALLGEGAVDQGALPLCKFARGRGALKRCGHGLGRSNRGSSPLERREVHLDGHCVERERLDGCASSDSGIAPRCQAAPSTITLAGRTSAEQLPRHPLRIDEDVLGARVTSSIAEIAPSPGRPGERRHR